MPDYQEIYAMHADLYDRLVSREDYEHRILPALRQICALEGLDAVELGAGTGRLTSIVAPLAKSLYILDASKHMLDFAIAKLERSGLWSGQAIVADHRALPLGDRTADLVLSGWSVCYLVVQHRECWRAVLAQALNEIERVLRPGGRIVLLETLGTGHETPQQMGILSDYYAFLEAAGFSMSWIRTDYRFETLTEADELTRFFFGEELAARVVENEWVILPECTGIWWAQV